MTLNLVDKKEKQLELERARALGLKAQMLGGGIFLLHKIFFRKELNQNLINEPTHQLKPER